MSRFNSKSSQMSAFLRLVEGILDLNTKFAHQSRERHGGLSGLCLARGGLSVPRPGDSCAAIAAYAKRPECQGSNVDTHSSCSLQRRTIHVQASRGIRCHLVSRLRRSSVNAPIDRKNVAKILRTAMTPCNFVCMVADVRTSDSHVLRGNIIVRAIYLEADCRPFEIAHSDE